MKTEVFWDIFFIFLKVYFFIKWNNQDFRLRMRLKSFLPLLKVWTRKLYIFSFQLPFFKLSHFTLLQEDFSDLIFFSISSRIVMFFLLNTFTGSLAIFFLILFFPFSLSGFSLKKELEIMEFLLEIIKPEL